MKNSILVALVVALTTGVFELNNNGASNTILDLALDEDRFDQADVE